MTTSGGRTSRNRGDSVDAPGALSAATLQLPGVAPNRTTRPVRTRPRPPNFQESRRIGRRDRCAPGRDPRTSRARAESDDATGARPAATPELPGLAPNRTTRPV